MLHIYTGSTDGRRGSDEFRLREAYRALRGDLDSDGMLELNTTELPARGATPQLLIEHVSTIPFLASARLVAVEGLLTSLGGGRSVAADWQPLLDALPSLPETNHLVLLEPARSRDQRAALGRSPLLRSLRALDGVDFQQFAELRLYGARGGRGGGNEVAAWLLARAEQRGIALEAAAAERLSELLGADLWALSGELDKLALYARGRAVRAADVDLLTTAAREEDVFAIVDDAVEGRAAPALRRLQRLLEHGAEPPARIQGLIARQLRNLVRAAELLEEGADREAIGAATGVTHPFPLGKLIDQARGTGRAAAEEGLRAVEAADHAVKTGRFADALALELLLTTLSEGPRSERLPSRGSAERQRGSSL